MRVQEWCQRDEFPVSCRSRNNLEQSDGEEGPVAGLWGCEQPDVSRRGQWSGHCEGRFVLEVVVIW